MTRQGDERPRLKRVTVRMATAPHGYLASAAARAGTNMTNYMREAALMRAAWENGVDVGRADPARPNDLAGWTAEVARLREELREQRLTHRHEDGAED